MVIDAGAGGVEGAVFSVADVVGVAQEKAKLSGA
jgi:hypothetical protein